MTRKGNDTYRLAYWYVTEYCGREWDQATDSKSANMTHAKSVLKDFPIQDVKGCLLAMRDGIFGDISFQIRISSIRTGEPTYMKQWIDYKSDPPPIYLLEQCSEWEQRTGRKVEDLCQSQTLTKFALRDRARQ